VGDGTHLVTYAFSLATTAFPVGRYAFKARMSSPAGIGARLNRQGPDLEYDERLVRTSRT
jgi:hypothetical protein